MQPVAYGGFEVVLRTGSVNSTMHRSVVGLLSAFVITAAHAQDNVPSGAMQSVVTYSRAVMAANCDVIVPISGLVARHPEAREALCDTYASWKSQGLVEHLQTPVANLSSGPDRLVIVPNNREFVSDGKTASADLLYVTYSNDAGRTWKVIDIGCDHLKDWIKGVYPAYDGHPDVDALLGLRAHGR